MILEILEVYEFYYSYLQNVDATVWHRCKSCKYVNVIYRFKFYKKMSNSYKLRVDTTDRVWAQSFVEHFSPKFYLYCFEQKKDGTPHIHFYIETDYNQNSIRTEVRKHTKPLKQDSKERLYSMNTVERRALEYLAYCTKEGEYVHNIDPDFLSEILEFEKETKENLKQRKTKKTQLEQIIDSMDLIYNEDVDQWLYRGFSLTTEIIANKVVEHFQEQGTLVREFQIVSLVQTLSLKLVPGYKASFVGRILERV